MILNVTKKPFKNFSAMQRLALNGEPLEHRPVDTIEQFEQFYDTLKDVKKVIVDGTNFILANDILNYVFCPVVTLGIEILLADDFGEDKINFMCYDYEENI